ncbi:MAG: NAD(+)/NADH kinase [Solirubrobacterales bacterium]
MSSAPLALLFTHGHAEGIPAATESVMAAAERHGWELLPEDQAGERVPELCIVLGGDGTVLHALRAMTGTKVPVFGVNFGRVGFLAAVDAEQIEAGLDRAFSGDIESIDLPGLEVSLDGEPSVGLNDIGFSRRPHSGVAELSYRIADEEVGRVRCDGLVASTATGSTGYNLANNGPILAWGVDGYAVTYIAPHTLTARALVVAPEDVLVVLNHRSRDSVDIVVDGVQAGELAPGAEAQVRYRREMARLAQLPGANFYHRIREKFGHLAV